MRKISRLGRLVFSSGLAILSIFPLQGREAAKISGTITDPAGSPIKDALVIFESTEERQSTRTFPDGAYSIRLSPGVYEVRAIGIGFCRMRRSPLLVEHRPITGIDFELVLGYTDTGVLQYSEEELDIPHSPQAKALVQFKKRSEDGTVEYKGLYEHGSYTRPIFTYDHWTLRANTLTYDPKSGTMSAVGSVLWQDGKTDKKVEHLKISLENPIKILDMN